MEALTMNIPTMNIPTMDHITIDPSPYDFNPFQGLDNIPPLTKPVTVHVKSVSPKDVKQKRAYHRRTPEEKAKEEAEKAERKREREIEKNRKNAERARKEEEKAAKKAEKSSRTDKEKALAKLTKHREKQIHQEKTSASLRKKITFLEAQMDELEFKLKDSEETEDDLYAEYATMADKYEDDYEENPDEELPTIPNIAEKSLVGFKLGDQNMFGEVIGVKDHKYIVQVLELDKGKVTKVDQVKEMDESDLEPVG